ncbi:hypothetical protein FGIG_04783 [Fasciola gigantica]|uniref:Uncharacterized protein n=1 Tax=Fasciola gigantica TaxID=46835 RepID=A0A504YKF5_FASGI|nr:hypothetical protein FGIG_04783 [Fasciola gigantica]
MRNLVCCGFVLLLSPISHSHPCKLLQPMHQDPRFFVTIHKIGEVVVETLEEFTTITLINVVKFSPMEDAVEMRIISVP